MHESFNVDDVNDYTRSWCATPIKNSVEHYSLGGRKIFDNLVYFRFAWANGLFGELILQLVVEKPQLVIKHDPQSITKAKRLVKIPVSLRAQFDTIISV